MLHLTLESEYQLCLVSRDLSGDSSQAGIDLFSRPNFAIVFKSVGKEPPLPGVAM